jgi:hypothetical protein
MSQENWMYESAALANWMIERVGADRVDLCESQGGQWITARKRITFRTAERFGFNPDAPAVLRVFDGLDD